VLSVPVAFAVMVLASLHGRGSADPELLALHAPEGLGLGLEDEERAALRLPVS
jgi:hypothetical protein